MCGRQMYHRECRLTAFAHSSFFFLSAASAAAFAGDVILLRCTAAPGGQPPVSRRSAAGQPPVSRDQQAWRSGWPVWETLYCSIFSYITITCIYDNIRNIHTKGFLVLDYVVGCTGSCGTLSRGDPVRQHWPPDLTLSSAAQAAAARSRGDPVRQHWPPDLTLSWAAHVTNVHYSL